MKIHFVPGLNVQIITDQRTHSVRTQSMPLMMFQKNLSQQLKLFVREFVRVDHRA